MIKPANCKIQLSQEEAHLMLMAFDSGLINLHSFQSTMSSVFYKTENEKKHTELMSKLIKLREELGRQILKKEESKSSILTMND